MQNLCLKRVSSVRIGDKRLALNLERLFEFITVIEKSYYLKEVFYLMRIWSKPPQLLNENIIKMEHDHNIYRVFQKHTENF